jgi:choline dehydrogenase-like flavoprotein
VSSCGEFDFVVVGAGSAGCALAARLAEKSGVTVCVLEAGREQWPKISAIPAAVLHTVGNPRFDWRYTSEPDPTRNGTIEAWPRGRGPGGSSLINGMIFVRGAPGDFDAWQALGAEGWGYHDLLPFFRRMEKSGFDQDPARGVHGPQSVQTLRWRHPVTEDFVQAAVESGITYNPDYNSSVQDGVGFVQAFQRNGRRHSAFDAFLKPVLSKRNVELRTGCEVHRLIIRSAAVEGVEYLHDDIPCRVRARRLVILCGGAINSPHLLMLSGIGPAAQLAAAGISVVADSPAVGQNLMEHATVWLQAEVNRPTLNQELTPFRKLVNLVRWLGGTGAATTAVAQATAFIRTHPESQAPDVQLHFCAMGTALGPKGLAMPKMPLVSIGATVSHPESCGEIRLRGPDPRRPPLILPRLLDSPRDIETLGQGLAVIGRILDAPTMKKRVVRLVNPPPITSEEQELESFIRANTGPAYHPVGTCRMGRGDGAVVDPRLRVIGVSGLAVADASVMPRHISGNTYAAAVMIGERAADLITEE